MTNKEKLEKAYELIGEANKLIDEVANSEPEVEPEDPVAEYKNEVNARYNGDVADVNFYVNFYGKSSRSCSASFDASMYNSYYQFLSKEYADAAARMYKMICMQLAFKWCHDRDFVPDWNNWELNAGKFYLKYSRRTKEYSVFDAYCDEGAVVYFSTPEIAHKCADWLNSLDLEKEGLI